MLASSSDSSSTTSSSSSDEEIVVRKVKVYKERHNYFEKFDDTEFFERFRLTKATVRALLTEIEDLIKLPSNR